MQPRELTKKHWERVKLEKETLELKRGLHVEEEHAK